MDGAVQHFCAQGLAPSTQRTYQSALRKFTGFCTSYSIVSPFPVSEAILCYYATHLACQQLSPQTIKIYLSAIRHMQITLGLPEPKEFSSLPRLRLVQAGIKRMRASTSDYTRLRLPITPAILHKIKEQWTPKIRERDTMMLWSAVTLCFFVFFRSGELTVPSITAYNEASHLSWGDISLDTQHPPQTLKVRLKKSKTDQFGKGADVFVGRTGDSLCPVTSTVTYMVVRGPEQGCFFKFSDGKPLTKSRFVHHVRVALEAAGLPYKHFAGHSFRIGAATAAARAGIEDSAIRIMGRWNSTAFLAYIRTPPNQLANISCLLSHS